MLSVVAIAKDRHRRQVEEMPLVGPGRIASSPSSQWRWRFRL